ncbi:hypothetical protein FN846DRAFT_889675 [Sphaerosporella brunnea]|uniref:Uncharacterized protein n=1 Tax=Sphaerosporella brunnea TaxID=1250544 RepID=A0A5J5EYV3_9PEZI|nr:hypothetical protein FN846DRAFT_889675 [Sphaerosporella brunnea]
MRAEDACHDPMEALDCNALVAWCTAARHAGDIFVVGKCIRAAQAGVFMFFDVYGFKASFGVKWLTDIDKQPVEHSDVQAKNARLSVPIRTPEIYSIRQANSVISRPV